MEIKNPKNAQSTLKNRNAIIKKLNEQKLQIAELTQRLSDCHQTIDEITKRKKALVQKLNRRDKHIVNLQNEITKARNKILCFY